MTHITQQLDGGKLERFELDGFPEETVLVIPVGDQLFECAFRIMETPSHTAPTEPARKPTLDEIALAAHHISAMARL